jgi:tryptophanase
MSSEQWAAIQRGNEAYAGDLTGMEIVYQPERLRHFTARFRPLSSSD